jgi:hypothetical protein
MSIPTLGTFKNTTAPIFNQTANNINNTFSKISSNPKIPSSVSSISQQPSISGTDKQMGVEYNKYSAQVYPSNNKIEAPSVSYKAVSIGPSENNFRTNPNLDPQNYISHNME